MTTLDPIPDLLRDALSILESAGAEAALIGGCARNAYADVRPTKDVDFVVAVDRENYDVLRDAARARGFLRGTAVGAAAGEVPDLELFRDPSGRRIDFLYAHTEFERSALARATTRSAYGMEVRVVSLEDLVVYKLLAGRPQDRLDILAMLAALDAGASPIDWAYIEHWCVVWDASAALDRLRAELVPSSPTG